MPQLLRGHSLYCGLHAPHELPFLDPLGPIRCPHGATERLWRARLGLDPSALLEFLEPKVR
jgi:hypothetical protein